MSLEFHKRVRQLFDESLERPEAERLVYLEGACGGDASLFDAVERLLVARSSSSTFLATVSHDAKRIGRYVIREELGRGAMGVVYDALDPMIGRSVAVKVIHLQAFTQPQEAEFLTERLFREARSAGQLFHPGIVIILDVGKEGDTAFIAMERVEGRSLQQIMAEGRRFNVGEALGILHQTASALDYAHEHNVVHRDIKPGNIMLHHGSRVKVADFGIAKVMSTQSTVAGIVMGTPSYMSPEQVQGQPVDGRSDQFSLAVLAYELLTGTRPFEGDSLATLSYLIVHGDRPSAKAANPALMPAGDDVLRRGLGKLPAERYPTCAEFIGALEAALSQPPPPATEKSMIEPVIENNVVKKQPANPALYLTVVAVVVAAVVLGLLFYRYSHSRPEPVASEIAPAPKVPVAAVVQPVIERFGADPLSIDAGTSTKLSWDVTGAKHIVIDNGIGKVEGSGTLVVTPSASVTYVLTATGSGTPMRATVSVEVKSKPAQTPPPVKATPPAKLPPPVPVPPSAAARARQLYEAAVEKRQGGLPGAHELYRQAAELGEPRAMLRLGEDYRDGDGGVAKDEKEAVRWFRMAADAGNPPGMVFLGAMYLMGDGVSASDQEAVQWFQKAADAGNPSGMYNLAGMYERGQGVPLSLDKAKELYRKSANLGNTEAQRRLAQLAK